MAKRGPRGPNAPVLCGRCRKAPVAGRVFVNLSDKVPHPTKERLTLQKLVASRSVGFCEQCAAEVWGLAVALVAAELQYKEKV